MAIVELHDAGDPRIADYRTLSDPDGLRARGLFIAEGRLVVRRLLTGSPLLTRSVLVTAPALSTLRDAVEARPDVTVYVVDQEALNDIAGFNIHRGCLAIGERPRDTGVDAWVAGQAPRSRVIALEGVTNADNVGGIFRCAAAFGAGGIVLGRGCVDPLYRKAIRTSMGAALHVPFAIDDQWPSSLDALRAAGVHARGADSLAGGDRPRHGGRLARGDRSPGTAAGSGVRWPLSSSAGPRRAPRADSHRSRGGFAQCGCCGRHCAPCAPPALTASPSISLRRDKIDLMRLALAQLNFTVGAFEKTFTAIRDTIVRARALGADLVAFTELATTGYPPRDLLFHDSFIDANLALIDRVAALTDEATGVVIGCVTRNAAGDGKPLFNTAALCHRGRVIGMHHKTLLPTYDVFDEARYFEPGTRVLPLDFKGLRLGITICEEIWNDRDFWPTRLYARDPVCELADQGADVLINISSSPFNLGKGDVRRDMIRQEARRTAGRSSMSTRSAATTSSCSMGTRLDSTVLERWSSADAISRKTSSSMTFRWVDAQAHPCRQAASLMSARHPKKRRSRH